MKNPIRVMGRSFMDCFATRGSVARDGVSAVALASMMYTGSVMGAFTTAPVAQAWTTLLGTSTSGSETGIYEYNALIETAIPIILLITILWAGLAITRRVIRSFRGS